MRVGGRIVRLVGVVGLPLALATIAVGGVAWYADGYPAVAQPVCVGLTADGCELRWVEVPTEDGGTTPACLQYCPWDEQPPQ